MNVERVDTFLVKNDINTLVQKTEHSFLSLMILIAIYYLLAIAVLTLHFTGHLERWGMEWLVFVFAATVFPAVLYL
ncbi:MULTISPECIES: hypothetical protein [unclassified Methylotenera]|jgi:Ca2+/Na+ antiporter|uniref:hypothetical protein n=1 Tax=unclassified Methylotenera TaxID=2643294 RepID=UPI000371CFA1|nr:MULTISPECIES: hypothetical protein [unclassified Methylotenera]